MLLGVRSSAPMLFLGLYSLLVLCSRGAFCSLRIRTYFGLKSRVMVYYDVLQSQIADRYRAVRSVHFNRSPTLCWLALFMPTGTFVIPEGTLLYHGHFVIPAGTFVTPVGTLVMTFGTFVIPAGTFVKPMGTSVKPAGTLLYPRTLCYTRGHFCYTCGFCRNM